MKHLVSSLVLALCAGLSAVPAPAQSDILLRLRSGSPAGDRFRVDSAGGVVAIGVLGVGIIPATGSGERMMWHPWRAAFRAGSIGAGGTQWDDLNTGFYSWAGGYNTTASQLASFAFGYQSTALGSYSTALGYTANAAGTGAVAIGYRSTADANYAVAIGQRASANGHLGAFVIADGSTTDSVQASADHQFSARMAGGYRLFTNATTTTGMSMNAGGSSWNVISDRTRKEHFHALDGESILARIRTLPVSSWRYIDEVDRSVRHVGPMAQDWERAFGLSGDTTTINMSDFDGVNLAGIQALERRTAGQDSRIQALEGENAALRAQNAALDERLRRLEALLSTP
jgi:trimeric autotransporter adhesin